MLKAFPEPMEFWELAVRYESQRGGVKAGEVSGKMRELLALMRKSLAGGLQGTGYEDRMLGPQSLKYGKMMNEGKLLEGRLLNRMLWYTTALMEVKSSLGVFVAAPTAGSCAALPAACLAMGEHYGQDDEILVKAFLSAGLVGVFIAAGSTFAAEVCGCQAECGSASGMIAAALLTLFGADVTTHLNGTSMALQNILGLTCDPVAERVEVPCLGKNVLAVSNAWSAANMALAGFDPVIPLGEVIAAMDDVGRSLPASLRCTGKGGLSITPTAQKISRQLS
jgi:L-serine dehydratase